MTVLQLRPTALMIALDMCPACQVPRCPFSVSSPIPVIHAEWMAGAMQHGVSECLRIQGEGARELKLAGPN